MRKCPSCGFNNVDTRDRCLKCSTALESAAVPDGSHLADAPEPRVHPLIAARKALYALGLKMQGELPANVPHRFPWSAAYLALILGAGQLYNRQPFRAALFAFIQIAFFAVCIYTIFQPWNNWLLLGLVFWHFYMMADGFSVAVRLNGDYWTWRQLMSVWFSVMFYLGAFLFACNFFGFGFFYLTTVNSRGLIPAFNPKDKVFVLAWPFKDRMVRRGSVVLYDPPRFVFIKSSSVSTDTYSLNEKNSFGVVTAEQGDNLTVDNEGLIAVNGIAVPPNQLPLIPMGVPTNINYHIPQEHLGILFSHRVIEEGFFSFLGGSWGGDMPTPRDAASQGLGIQMYDNVTQVPKEEIDGIVLFRFNPPERREWFGLSGGLYHAYPQGYPAPKSAP